MIATPIELTQHHRNLAGQNVLTFVRWALTIILLVVTIEMGRRERSPVLRPHRPSRDGRGLAVHSHWFAPGAQAAAGRPAGASSEAGGVNRWP